MENQNLTRTRQYLSAIENRVSSEELASFFAPELEQVEFPNRLVPNGATRNLDELLEAQRRGKNVLQSEKYDIQNAIASGDFVALEVIWTGTLGISLGAIEAGCEMRAHFAVFLEFKEGKIVSQHNYDCFDPF